MTFFLPRAQSSIILILRLICSGTQQKDRGRVLQPAVCLLSRGVLLAHFCSGDACHLTTKEELLVGLRRSTWVEKGPPGGMSCDPVVSSVPLCRKRLFVQPSMSVYLHVSTQHSACATRNVRSALGRPGIGPAV